MLANDEKVKSFIGECYGAPKDSILDISLKKTRDDMGLHLWRAMNIRDLSTARFYLALTTKNVILFDTDFLSRHEISAPVERDLLPDGWNKWCVVKGSSVLVSNPELFMKSMLTADAFVALPPYRFDQLADDISDAMVDTGEGVLQATFGVLTKPGLGYSFRMYCSCIGDVGKSTEPCFEYSILKGTADEGINLCGPAPEQFQLWENGG